MVAGLIRSITVCVSARDRVASRCVTMSGIGCAVAGAMLAPLLALSPAAAETWSFDPVVTTREYVFGDVRIVRAVDATEDTQYPEWTVGIFVGDELRAFYGGVSFDHIVASSDNRLFVGISNSGLPGTALVVFDRRGVLLTELEHDPALFDYCEQSETLVRRWYDAAQPDLRLETGASGGALRATVRGCAGNRIDLGALLDDAR